MAIFKDIITDNDFDLSIVNGDISVLESDSQHIDHIITADKGHFRQFPLVGVGIVNFLNSSTEEQEIRQSIKLQLEADGFSVKQIKISASNIEIDAERKSV
ncbi:hypothetical protein UFOVP105_14 [uncultured Caudovirales phage]|uniref:Uncharacterized protein n=1 Tax=uncultured Caudovirales phage TaxID=2100421 RepID=A0A6J5KZT1_9CAUD|nr:hypothetical protein UFOVP105_14 [uncultured Caudovirales phage]